MKIILSTLISILLLFHSDGFATPPSPPNALLEVIPLEATIFPGQTASFLVQVAFSTSHWNSSVPLDFSNVATVFPGALILTGSSPPSIDPNNRELQFYITLPRNFGLGRYTARIDYTTSYARENIPFQDSMFFIVNVVSPPPPPVGPEPAIDPLPPNPFPALELLDTQFVTAPGISFAHRNRAEVVNGVISFDIPVTRAIARVGDLDRNGRLVFPVDFINKGIVSSTATLKIAVFDVDSSDVAGSSIQSEIDLVFLRVDGSSKPLKNITPGAQCPIGIQNCLSGLNGQWSINTFEVPIDLIQFPNPCDLNATTTTCRPDSSGFYTPIPRQNTIEIHIDTKNSQPIWRVALDWASLSFKAMSPTIFIHGLNGSKEQGGLFVVSFFTSKLLFDKSIQLPGWFPDEGRFDLAESLNCSAKRLAGYMRTAGMASHEAASGCHNSVTPTSISAIAKRFGVNGVHLVTHSKGGMDAREFIARYAQRGEIISLTTLGTPHKGSVLSDLSVAVWETSYIQLIKNICTVVHLFKVCDIGTFKTKLEEDMGGIGDGVRNLTTQSASQFNSENLPYLVEYQTTQYRPTQYFTISADADRDGDGILSSNESDGLPNGDVSYQILGEIAAIDIQVQEYCITFICYKQVVRILGVEVGTIKGGGWRTGPVGVTIPSPIFQPNDGAVTVESAQDGATFVNLKNYTGAEAKNHMALLGLDTADFFIPHLKKAEAISGDFQ